MRKILLAATLAALSATGAMASPINLLTNGSFEYPVDQISGSWDHIGPNALDGWTGDPNVEVQTQQTLNIAPDTGQTYVEIDTNTNASLFQTVTLDRGRYEFSFAYRPRVNIADGANNNLDLTATGTGVNAGVSVHGAPNPDFPINVWSRVSLMFLVGADDTDVTFTFTASGPSGRNDGESCGNCGALVDTAHLAPVPLPAGAVLLIGAIGGLAALRRRKAA